MILMKTTDTFLKKFATNCLYNFRCEEIILGGDFNLVIDVEKDKKEGLPKTYQCKMHLK